jgi:hypothetical protein
MGMKNQRSTVLNILHYAPSVALQNRRTPSDDKKISYANTTKHSTNIFKQATKD